MNQLLKMAARRLIPHCPRCRKDPHKELTYSQDGEDCILRGIFQQQREGFYVDVGAHHPKRFSNTCVFYERGWRGLNVDPIAETKSLFATMRPRDINVQCGIASEAGELDYFVFDEPAYNSFSQTSRNFIEKRGFPKLIATRKVPVYRLSTVLEKYVPQGQGIDFLTVDVEGFEMQVLESNDWSRFRPRVVVCEDGADILAAISSPVTRLLDAVGYKMLARTTLSAIYALC